MQAHTNFSCCTQTQAEAEKEEYGEMSMRVELATNGTRRPATVAALGRGPQGGGSGV